MLKLTAALLFALFYSEMTFPREDQIFWSLIGSVQTYQSAFEQTSGLGDLGDFEIQNGRVIIKKPHFMKWSYGNPVERVIYKNERQLLIYDPLLSQVVITNLEESSYSVLDLLFSENKKLRSKLVISKINSVGEKEKFLLVPSSSDFGFLTAHVEFTSGTLSSLRIKTNLEQIIKIKFSNVSQNADVPKSTFDFAIPKGTDVIEDIL